MQCKFCDSTIINVRAAIHADWIPTYFDGDVEIDGPVCPRCQLSHLRQAEDGELELARE